MSLDARNIEISVRPARLDCIDGLRGWASLMVVLSHLWGQFAKHVVPFYDLPLLRVISDGHIAVLIFFVLSGVALSLRFVQKPQPVSLVGLVVARYVRLTVPILVTTLIVYLLISLNIAGSAESARISGSQIFFNVRQNMDNSFGGAILFALYSVLFDYQPQTTFNTSLWTMPVEFRGSLIVFGLLFLFSQLPGISRRYRILIVCVLTTALLLFSKQLAACFTAGYVLTELIHTRAVLVKWLRLAPLGFIAASFALVKVTGLREDTSDTFLAIGLVMAALYWPMAKRFLSNATSLWLGRISFPLYLIHVPVISSSGLLYLLMRNNDFPEDLATHITVVIALAGSLLFARLLLPVEWLSIQLSRMAGNFRLFRW